MNQIIRKIAIMRNRELIDNAVNDIKAECVESFEQQRIKSEPPRPDSSESNKQSSSVKYSLDVPVDEDDYEGVSYSVNIDTSYSKFEKLFAERTSFSQTVLELINKKDIPTTKFYKKAHIDRKLFSKLKTDYCYKPSRITAIKLCFALDLSFGEAEELLGKAGVKLMKWDPFDLAIAYCFKKGITDIDIINEILTQLELSTI
ncbi:MAG: hypothetical protein E7520_03115 [Ruminococcaceae bacterium]|nr:hypothetical protein [Oscillospiraceae bacterium]